MLSIAVGPIALPLLPLLLLGAVWAASSLASRTAARNGDTTRAVAAGRGIVHAATAGLVAARIGYLVMHASAYASSPWSMFDLRDGGWHALTGAVAATAWLALIAGRAPDLRRALVSGGVAGAALWATASWITGTAATHPMPTMAFTAFDGGQEITLPQAVRGRPAVVNLWASWCGPCRQEMPALAAAQQRHPDIAFVFVNQGEARGAVQAYLTQQRLALQHVLLDPGSALGPAVGSAGLPTTLFYDGQGRQVNAHFGVLNAAAIESRLQALRAER